MHVSMLVGGRFDFAIGNEWADAYPEILREDCVLARYDFRRPLGRIIEIALAEMSDKDIDVHRWFELTKRRNCEQSTSVR